MPIRLPPQEMLAHLIGFDTTSRKSNLALVGFVRDYLDGHGIRSELVYDDQGAKANLIASIGPADRAGIVLSGHTDVVPVDDQDWSSDPFTAIARDGRIFGRGSADMKGFIATALALLPGYPADRLQAPIHLALSYDEEVGCKGVPRLLDRLIETLEVLPQGCVVGEPTGMAVANGHKGKAGYRCIVTGLESHSALNHLGVNAIEFAALIVAELHRANGEFAANGPFAAGFEPPHTTVSTGTIAGGTALNIVPGQCRFTFEFRTVPGQSPSLPLERIRAWSLGELLPAMRRVAPEAAIEFDEILSYPGLDAADDPSFEAICRRLTATPAAKKLAFGSEAGHFAARNIPAVVCGPGDIAVAHKADEYVELVQLDRCTTFLDNLIREIALAA